MKYSIMCECSSVGGRYSIFRPHAQTSSLLSQARYAYTVLYVHGTRFHYFLLAAAARTDGWAPNLNGLAWTHMYFLSSHGHIRIYFLSGYIYGTRKRANNIG